ncbi:uracil-DNA glycosylase [Paenibacillus thermotolerans]|uniref:uracil-DNA glycosylase n=1 Tax=Paenibacillus thermotolerans TaxID=3027807 RepID=UPI002368BB06|nr:MULTISPECIES: uracil-DNA glycosylase [unclassified Paenibacillus]
MMENRTPFAPEAWPEDPAPPHAADCRNCELFKQRKRVIWGEGNPNGPLLALLDNPGAREDANGEAFVCATRAKLQQAVHDAGLTKEDVYATYLLKCRPIRAYDKAKARESCGGWLAEQTEAMRPKAVVLLGLVVAQHVLGLPEAEMSDLRGRWHEAFGAPAIVTYHPLAVHRRPNLYRNFAEDWAAAAARLKHQ